jgi:hypothetical protein
MRHRRIRAGGRGRGSGGPALRAYLVEMRSLPKALMLALAAVLAFGTLDAASARAKKRHVKHPETPIVTRDYDGTPIIMEGFRMPRAKREEKGGPEALPQQGERPKERAAPPVRIPRGSSTYIPPPVPSPYAGSPPPLTQPPGVYRPPPINSFGDRVIDAIHAYPLEKGLGNNPADQQMFIRQRANQ